MNRLLHRTKPTSGYENSILPESLKPIWCQLGVPHRVLDILVAQIVLDRPGVMSLVRQIEPTGMAQHVGVDREIELSLPACSGDQLGKLPRKLLGCREHQHEHGRESPRHLPFDPKDSRVLTIPTLESPSPASAGFCTAWENYGGSGFGEAQGM